jgi:hypothetical protein
MSETIVVNSTLPPPPDGNGSGWEIAIGDIRKWKNKDRDRFLQAVFAAGKTGIGKPLYPELARLIKRWPYPYDPSKVDSYGEIDGYELEEALNRVVAAFQQPQS